MDATILAQELHVQSLSFVPARKLKALLRLSFFGKKPASFSDFERYLGYSAPAPDIRSVLRFLLSKGILEEAETLFGVTRYKIHQRKLRDFVDDLAITELFAEYFTKHHFFVW